MQNWQSIEIKAFVFGVFALLITGCSQHQKLPEAMQDYHQRLARILGTEAIDIELSVNINLPAKPEVFREPQALNFNFREFYALPDCRLNTLIAERNTGLGKTQLPSQRFIYESDLLIALAECLQISDNEAIKSKLTEVLQAKRKQYPHSYANLLQTSDEVVLSFTRSKGFVSGDLSDGLQETQIALQYLHKLHEVNLLSHDVNSAQLEASLKDLNQFRLVARMWRSQQLITQWFEQSTPWLESQTVNLNCMSRSGKQKIQYLNNVFTLFFVEKIQPIAGQLNNYHYKLFPVLESLSTNVNLDPAWRSEIAEHISTGHQIYKHAMRNHIVVWQQLFKRCGMSPTVKNT